MKQREGKQEEGTWCTWLLDLFLNRSIGDLQYCAIFSRVIHIYAYI